MSEELDDEIEFHQDPCPSCKADHTHIRTCWNCGGEGFHELYDLDPCYYDPDDTEPCQECHGMGDLHWCRACGYDFYEKRRLGVETPNAPVERSAPSLRASASNRLLGETENEDGKL